MPRYIVLSKFNDAALKSLREHPDPTTALGLASLDALAATKVSYSRTSQRFDLPQLRVAATERFGKTRSRKSAGTGRARFRRFEIGD